MKKHDARLGSQAISALLAAAALLGAASALVASQRPAEAQFFFDDRYPFMERRRLPQYYGPSYRDYQYRDYREAPRPPPVDSSKAPAPTRKPDPNAKMILVLGDSMADWLAYGLEEAFAETPELGVTRKHRTVSGLIRNEGRTESFDWVQSARDILAAEKPGFIVVMIGAHDRHAIRERRPAPQSAQRTGSPSGQSAAQPGQAGQRGGSPAQRTEQPAAQRAEQPAPAAKPAEPGQDQAAQPSQAAQQAGDESASPESPSIVAAEPAATGTLTHEFRSERWVELYTKRIDDFIAVLKTKGAPVYWVGLPAIRGTRSTSDVAYLNELFRSRAERAGIVYVDIWDGFADDNGAYIVQGPDVEGQTRRLRTGDGVHFTKFGARKLAHYVEREIQRSLVARPVTVSLPEPEEPLQQQGPAKPSGPAPRPPAGPIVYLTGAPKEGEELLGAGAAPARAAPNDPATQVLVKGEPLTAPAGRADDFAWPRRPIATTSVTNIQEPETPPAPGSPAARAAAAGAQPAAAGSSPPAAPRPQQKVAQPKNAPPPPRSPFFFPFWPFGR